MSESNERYRATSILYVYSTVCINDMIINASRAFRRTSNSKFGIGFCLVDISVIIIICIIMSKILSFEFIYDVLYRFHISKQFQMYWCRKQHCVKFMDWPTRSSDLISISRTVHKCSEKCTFGLKLLLWLNVLNYTEGFKWKYSLLSMSSTGMNKMSFFFTVKSVEKQVIISILETNCN